MAIDEDTRKPPVWLTEEFVTKGLQKGLKEPFLQVRSMDLKPAVAVGDNYASLMFRAVLKITKMPSMSEERLSVVIKTMPKVGALQEFMVLAFLKEAKMMQLVLPEMNKRLKEVLPDHKPLSACCLWFTEEPEPVLILEDLKELGFGLADRMNGLDANMTNIVLDSLAKFHAASLAIARDQPEKLAGFEQNIWEENEEISTMAKCGLDGLIEEVSDWQDFPKEYTQRLINLRPVIVERMRTALKMDPSFLNVVIHGDCWVNNMMAYPEKSPAETLRFVDFQISMINSAAIDLNYFIFTSPNNNIRFNIEEMLTRYYTRFMDTVKKLGVKLDRNFTLDDLRNDFRKRAFFGFIAAIIIYPITITPKKDVRDVNDFFDEKTSKRSTYQNEIFKNTLPSIMAYFINCGVL